MHVAGFLIAVLIGVSLGLLGGGGSILAVPILVYAVGMAAKPAIAVSLLVVGATSLVGSLRHWKRGNVDLRTALVFGVVSMAGSYGGGKLATQLTDTVQLTLFAVVMLAASVSMFRPARQESAQPTRVRLPLVVAAAAGVGVLTGVVGVGGGFLIVPALVLFGGLAMKQAVGTSLLVIAMNSVSGFLAYAGDVRIDWGFTLLFTGLAVIGVFAGSALAHYVSAAQLRRGFAIFLIAVATFVLVQSAITTRAHAAPSPKPAQVAVRDDVGRLVVLDFDVVPRREHLAGRVEEANANLVSRALQDNVQSFRLILGVRRMDRGEQRSEGERQDGYSVFCIVPR